MSPALPALLASAALLVPNDPAAGGAGEDEHGWLELDRSVSELAGGLGAPAEGWRAGALLRTFYEYTRDDLGMTPEHVSGVDLHDADVWVETAVGRRVVRVAVELDEIGGDAHIEDAYVTLPMAERTRLKLGLFKPRLARSTAVDPEGLLFADRTFVGQIFDTRDAGVELGLDYEEFQWWLSLTNGASELADHHLYTVRGEWNLYDPGLLEREGSRGADRLLHFVFGGTWFQESFTPGTEDAHGFGFDVAFTLGPHAFHAEIMNLGDGVVPTLFDAHLGPVAGDPNASPYSLTYSCLLNEEWEVGVRLQGLRDDDDIEAMGVALDWYPVDGPFAIVTNLVDYDSNGPVDGLVFQAGIHLGTSR
jgi:hypothetical protein